MTTKAKQTNEWPPNEAETRIQQRCIHWFRLQHAELWQDGVLFHISNEGIRSPRMGARFKKEGGVPGVADLCLALPRGGYGALYIEMKRPGTYQTQSQKLWQKGIEKHSNRYAVCRSLEEFQEAVEEYLKIPDKAGASGRTKFKDLFNMEDIRWNIDTEQAQKKFEQELEDLENIMSKKPRRPTDEEFQKAIDEYLNNSGTAKPLSKQAGQELEKFLEEADDLDLDMAKEQADEILEQVRKGEKVIVRQVKQIVQSPEPSPKEEEYYDLGSPSEELLEAYEQFVSDLNSFDWQKDTERTRKCYEKFLKDTEDLVPDEDVWLNSPKPFDRKTMTKMEKICYLRAMIRIIVEETEP